MSAGGVSLRNNVASAVVNIAAVFRSDFVYIPACWPVEFVRTGVQNIVGLICGLRCSLSAGTGSVSRRDAVVLCTLLCLRWCCRRLGRFRNRRVCRLRRRSRFRRCSRSRRCFGSDFGDRVGKLDVPRPFLRTRDSADGAENDPEGCQQTDPYGLVELFYVVGLQKPDGQGNRPNGYRNDPEQNRICGFERSDVG